MGKRVRILVSVVVFIIYIFNPLNTRTNVSSFVGSLTVFANLTPVLEPDSLKAAISNVTGDFDQLTNILQDFFDRMPENSTEQLFRDFLTSKASRRHKDLERYLDWLLGFYRFAWPFLIVYIILRLSSSSAVREPYESQRAAERIRKGRRKNEDYPDERSPRSADASESMPSSQRRPLRSSSAQSFG